VAAQDPPSEESIRFFQQNCASCHTIGGGRLVGPDLKDVDQRAERDWLVDFILDPKGVIDSGDPYGQQILGEARGVYMTPVPGMTRELASKLLDLVAAESLLEESRFAGLALSDRPLTEADVERGRELFTGAESIASGAPACSSCHDVSGLSALGGGRLGPDLTSAYARLEGRKALGAWLSSPPSAIMQPLFQAEPLDSEEILALVAFLKDAAEGGAAEAESSALGFVLSGIGLAAVLMGIFDVLWRNRFRGVRRTLVARAKIASADAG
jgi:mono/diheme cytochrome c family protein